MESSLFFLSVFFGGLFMSILGAKAARAFGMKTMFILFCLAAVAWIVVSPLCAVKVLELLSE